MKKIILLLVLSATCFAQQPPCGLTSIKETTPLLYPPIAKAVHVTGTMIFLVSFKQSGEVEKVEVLSGPKLLTTPATTYVRGLHANEYGGTRTSPIVINYLLEPTGIDPRPIEKSDLQHVTIYGGQAVLHGTNNPAGKRIKRFWI